MAHSDVLIFLVTVSWTALIFIFCYLLLVLLILPSLYKKIRVRQLLELSAYHDFLEAVRSSVSGTLGVMNDCAALLVGSRLILSLKRCAARGTFPTHSLKFGLQSFRFRTRFSSLKRPVVYKKV